MVAGGPEPLPGRRAYRVGAQELGPKFHRPGLDKPGRQPQVVERDHLRALQPQAIPFRLIEVRAAVVPKLLLQGRKWRQLVLSRIGRQVGKPYRRAGFRGRRNLPGPDPFRLRRCRRRFARCGQVAGGRSGYPGKAPLPRRIDRRQANCLGRIHRRQTSQGNRSGRGGRFSCWKPTHAGTALRAESPRGGSPCCHRRHGGQQVPPRRAAEPSDRGQR